MEWSPIQHTQPRRTPTAANLVLTPYRRRRTLKRAPAAILIGVAALVAMASTVPLAEAGHGFGGGGFGGHGFGGGGFGGHAFSGGGFGGHSFSGKQKAPIRLDGIRRCGENKRTEDANDTSGWPDVASQRPTKEETDLKTKQGVEHWHPRVEQ